MNGQKIPWWMPKVEKEDSEFVKKALDANFVNEGPLTAELEKQIANLVGAKYATATTSGTAAIFLSLKALGIGHGDEVIVPDVTFIATANAVDLCGAKPILVDINPKDLTISIDAIKKTITSKTKAIVPVHVTGRGADMAAITEIAEKHGLFVVEDAAEALTSKQGNQYLGTFGDLGCFSFSANKTISTGEGVCVDVVDASQYNGLNHTILRNNDHGQRKRTIIFRDYSPCPLPSKIGISDSACRKGKIPHATKQS